MIFLELKDYLTLEKKIIPWKYRDTIYEKLRIEFLEETKDAKLTNPEDIRATLERYNDKWNAIREEYGRIFGSVPVFMPEDLFKERYESELVTEEPLQNADEFYLLGKDLHKIGDDIYVSGE